MENNNSITISKVCGLCAGCKHAVDSTIEALEKHNNVKLFKEIVHNKTVNNMLKQKGVCFEDDLNNFSQNDFVIIRAHGEPQSTFEFLNSNNIPYCDCTCQNVKKIHEAVFDYTNRGYTAVIIGKYGKKSGIIHPEIAGTIGWCSTEPILIETDDDLEKFSGIKNQKLYLTCQTTFNEAKATELIEKIESICNASKNELVVNKSICLAQTSINKFSVELAKQCDLMVVLGGKNSSNTTELYNNIKNYAPTIFIENINMVEEELKNNNLTLTKETKIGLTAGASTSKDEIEELKQHLENIIKEL